MNKRKQSLEEHFRTLRNAQPMSFDHSREIIAASTVLNEYNGMLPSLRLDASLFIKRCLDFFLVPIISAGLSLLFIIVSGSQIGIGEMRLNSSKPIFASIETSQKNTSILSSVRHSNKNVQERINKSAQSNFDEPKLTSQESDTILPISNVNLGQISAPLNINTNSPSYNVSKISQPLEKPELGIMITLRTIGFQQFGSGISPTTKSPFENAAVSISYALDIHQSVGIEIGQEGFLRHTIAPYEILIGDPRTGLWTKNTIEQRTTVNNLLTWFGAFYNYSLPELRIFGSIHPFAQVFAGATSQGPLAKGMLGFEFHPDNSLHFRIGAESSYLNYAFQGTRQSSIKYGLTAGLGVSW